MSILFCFVELFFEFVHSFFECFGLAFSEVDCDLEYFVGEPGAPNESEGDCERQDTPKWVDEVTEGDCHYCEGSDNPKGKSWVGFDFHLL